MSKHFLFRGNDRNQLLVSSSARLNDQPRKEPIAVVSTSSEDPGRTIEYVQRRYRKHEIISIP